MGQSKALEGLYSQLARGISGAPFSGCWKAWLIIVMGDEQKVGKEKERER
jgi:hypothetical protein